MRIASSMSWVTKITVLASRRRMPRNSACRPRPHDRVDRAERLVHQHHRRIGGERARHADALALPAREMARIAVEELSGLEADQRQHFLDARRDPRGGPAEQLRHGGDVLRDRHVREQPDLLDDVADAAAQLDRVGARDVLALDDDAAGVGSISRLTMRMVVVLPQPEGPISTQVVPSGTSRSSRSTAGRGAPGKILLTFSSRIMRQPRSTRRTRHSSAAKTSSVATARARDRQAAEHQLRRCRACPCRR